MKEITMYQTKDGNRFCVRQETEEHEKLLDFKDWYEENKLF